jgi:IS4 transposase
MVRFHSTAMPLYDYRGQRVKVLEKLRTLNETMVGDWNVYLINDNGEKVKGRLCAIRKSQEAIEKAKKEIRKAASKKQRKLKADTLKYAEYVIIFTTVNRHQLKKQDVMELYRARWQVELSFKRLKGIMNLGHLHKSDPESCKAWLHGKMFVALLVERVYQEAEFFSPWGYPIIPGTG